MPTVTRAALPDDLEPQEHHAALLFDWDGTLADSQAVNATVLDLALRAQGAALDHAWFDAHTGLSTHEIVERMGALHGVAVDVALAAADRDRHYLERVAAVGEVAVVVALLRRQAGRRPCALATGGVARTVLPTVERLGLRALFDAVVTRDDVERGKPAPDLFLLAAERLGAAPRTCLVYEDSDEGLAAATAAGMDAVDVRPLRPSPGPSA